MDYNTFNILASDAQKALAARRLGDALSAMVGMAACMSDGELADRVSRVQADYELMLDYMVRGFEDTGREALYTRFLTELVMAWQGAVRQADLQRADNRATYVTTLRTLQSMDVPHSLTALAEHWRETSPRVLFETIWTSALWSEEDAAAVRRLYDEADTVRRALLLSATMLAALHYFDVKKLVWLLDAVESREVKCRVRALVGAVLVTIRWAEVLPFFPEVREQWEAVAATDKRFCDHLAELQSLLLMTLEVKRIETKMQGEIIPQMMDKVRELRKAQEKLKGITSVEDLTQLTENPEWEKVESRFTGEMQQMIDMQRKGADVFISSFRTLKSRFPFFSVACNWFYPFTTQHPDLSESVRNGAMARFMEHGRYMRQQLCDSDCYSISLMFGDTANPLISRMTVEMQKTLGLDFDSAVAAKLADGETLQDENLDEAMHRVLRSYVQDVYRYFKLFRGRDERVDPFKCDLLMLDYPWLAPLLDASGRMKDLADFAFDVKSYAYAAAFYERIEPTAETLQKMGYCHQHEADYEHAAACYERANLMKGDSAWTLRQLATCYRRLGRTDDALRVYEQLGSLSPDDASTALRTALCHMEQEDFEAAMPQLYKAYYLAPDNADVLRAIAWCCFRLHDDEKAEGYYAKLLAATPKAEDYLNAGHVAWVMGNVGEAVKRYTNYLQQQPQDFLVGDTFKADASLLQERGISQDELNIMCDALSSIH